MADSALGGLSVFTNIRYSLDKLKKLNNISYMFNPSWDASGKTRVGSNTLPMSLLYITGLKEIGQSEVTSEQLLLYRGEDLAANDTSNEDTYKFQTPQSVLNVVADNIVNKPRQWQIEAIVPDTYDALINGAFSPTFFGQTDFEILSSESSSLVPGLTFVPNVVFSAISDIVSLLSSLVPLFEGSKWGGLMKNSPEELFNLIQNGSTYNKDSLIDMWMSRAILKFKPPMEWNYKTVVITNFDISKRPNEDNCHRLSMTIQEVPIMTTGYYTGLLSGIKSTEKLSGSSIAVKYIGDALRTVLNKVGREV